MKNFGLHQIDEQAQFFLAAVSADVDQAVGAVVEDDVGFAAVEVVDDAEDALLIAGNDARAEDDGVALIDVRVLVVVDGGAAEGAHRFALRAADENHELVGGIVVHLAGIDDEAGGNVEIAEVLRDFGALHHGAAEDATLRPCSRASSSGDADAIDGRGEAAEEELLLRREKISSSRGRTARSLGV